MSPTLPGILEASDIKAPVAIDWGVITGMYLSPTAATTTPAYSAVVNVVIPLKVIFESALSFFSSTGGDVLTGVGATVHGIKLGNCVTFTGGGGAALTIGFGPGAADALFILRSDPPTMADEIRIVRIKYLRFPFKEIPNDYGQKYFF